MIMNFISLFSRCHALLPTISRKCSDLSRERRETSSSWILLTFSRSWRHQMAYISRGRIESFPQHKIDIGTFLIFVVVVLLLFTSLLQALHRTAHHSTVQSFHEDTAAQTTKKSDEGERTEKKVSEFSSPFISLPPFLAVWCEKSFKFPSKCIPCGADSVDSWIFICRHFSLTFQLILC